MAPTWLPVALSLLTTVSAGSLKDVKHVVMFMQENRGFDHYFGAMRGVRGFADPNVHVNSDGRSTFQQPVTSSQSTAVSQLTPWYFNYLGGEWYNATNCISGGGYSWQAMHESYNAGKSNQWASENSAYSLGYFKRHDLPTHYEVADGWTVADMYTESVLAATDPNRITWMSGTVNNPGTPSNPDGEGSMMIDNNATPGCEAPHLNCYPMKWKTVPEYWQAANVSWQLYQDTDNFEDNMLAYFEQYQAVSDDADAPLTKFGNSYIGLDRFYADAEAGTLPLVSYIIGPAELSEHQPYLHTDGAWLINQVINAVTKGKAAKETVLLISYDEVGGYMDHVVPYTAPPGTPGMWIEDPYNISGYTPVGPGYRVPFLIVSPWTRGGQVFTEHADHTSQIMFVEKWLEALGYENVTSKEIPPWRREHMSDLVNAFDFENPDFSIPTVAQAAAPLTTPGPEPTPGSIGAYSGNYVGAAHCLAEYDPYPPVPYNKANAEQNMTLATEQGFRPVRGNLTEGRYLTFESNKLALTNLGHGKLGSSPSTANHSDIRQRWVLHQQGDGSSNVFNVSSALDGRYIGLGGAGLVASSTAATPLTFTFLGPAKGYSASTGLKNLVIGELAASGLKVPASTQGFEIFSVTYHS